VFVITKQGVLVMIVAELLTELKAVLPESQVKEEDQGNHPLGNNGHVVVYPKSEEEIAEVLRYANNNGKKISIIGRGTKRGYGGQIETADILLSLIDYTGIVEHAVGDMTVTVKSGTRFMELQSYLGKHNQKVSLDPPFAEYATIGGVTAANESGPKRLGYGSARDAVIGLRVVYPDGTIIRTGGKVVKNVAGYDMNKLFIGSMGTLGVISEVTLKLRPMPKYESLMLLSFPEGNFDAIRTFVITILDSTIEPTSLELLSPSVAKRLTGQHSYTLAMSFEDVDSSVRYQEEFVRNIQPDKTNLSIFHQQEAKEFWENLSTTRPATSENEHIEATLKIGVVNLDVINVIRECQLIQDVNNVSIESHGGLGHGLCQVDIKGTSEDIIVVINQLREFTIGLGGYLIVKHLPFSLRQKISVWGEKPAHFFLLEGIKAKNDPNRVLNYKRFVGGI
jgi:glycolate oxidase FAD binding subunit